MPSSDPSVAVLGAGITGLSIAWHLRQKEIPVTVYEKSGQPGGVIQTRKDSGWQWEQGPNTIQVKSEEMWQLLRDLGLEEEIVEAGKSARKRYIVKNGSLSALPMSLNGLVTTDLFSATAKFRLLKEPFIEPADTQDESIASFVRRRLGEEILDYSVNPFVSGIFAGDPERLSIKHTFSMLHEAERDHGSILKGMIKKKKESSARRALISFRDGLQQLPKAMAGSVGDSVHFNSRVTGLEKSGRKWQLTIDNGENGQKRVSHDLIVSTIPAYLLPELFSQTDQITEQIAAIPYAPMSVITIGYPEDKIHHPLDGFGMLVPEKENFDILGTLFSSTLFEDRTPEGHALLTSFVGGARHPELAHLPKDDLVARVQYELDRLLGISGTPEFVRHTYWEKAIPQYEMGYDRHLEAISKLEGRHEGIFLAGNFRGGISVPDCIRTGFETAEKVALLF